MALIQSLASRWLPRARLRPEQRTILDAIEQVVDRIDPRLHLVKGYQKKLRTAVEESLNYAGEMVDRLPPSLEISSRTWNSDPAAHAFFSSTESLQRTVSRSQALSAFFESPENAEADDVFAVLTMTKHEIKRFGSQLQGEAIHKEVLQTSVGFVDHVVALAGVTEASVRTALRKVAFEQIVLHALGQVACMKSLKSDLEKEQAMLQVRYRLLQGKSDEAETVFGAGTNSGEKLLAIETKLAENNRQLREMFDRFKTLEDYLVRVKTILEHPQNYVKLIPTTVRLNRMNIMVDEFDPQGNDVRLLEASVINRPHRVVLLVKYPRKEFLPKEDFLEMAKRYLG
ncbi:MAG: hypothetical protein WA970_21410 [Gammaproteobacteria bacterium]